MTGQDNPSEALIQAICHKMFFRDFVASNPEFKRGGGEQKEAADVLVLFRDVLIGIQVKGRAISAELDPTSEVVLERLTKRVDRMLDQLKTLKRAVASGFLKSVVTGRGIELPLSPDEVSEIIGVAILDVTDEEDVPPESRPDLLDGYELRHGIPTHVFLRSAFERIADELDTLPDFLQYLRARRRLYEAAKLAPLTSELDLLAVYKTDYPTIEKLLTGELDMLVLEDGIWEQYVARADEARRKRKWRNQPSYLIDAIVEDFHTSVGFLLAPGTPAGQLEGTVEGYFRAVTELATLNRLERRVLGEGLMAKMQKAERKGSAFGVMIDPDKSRGHLVLASSRPRLERRTALENMVNALAAHMDVQKVVGIATEPASSRERSFDIAVVTDPGYTPEEAAELRALGAKLFGPPRFFNVQDWD